jgi:glycosyltransferase involved in cell wall biosynthesis
MNSSELSDNRSNVATIVPEISVCIITFRRPRMLATLLEELTRQESDGLFQISIVVVDNDREESARETVNAAARRFSIPISYDVEREQNLSLARNRCIQNATGEYLAYIDDDEIPPARWLVTLYQMLVKAGVDGALGPVYPKFEIEAPAWLTRSRAAERPELPTGRILNWQETRSGNVLMKRSVCAEPGNRFDPRFASHGEDRDFFRRVMAQGARFVWCAEAAVPEIQPAERLRRRFYFRRALLRGSVSWKQAPSLSLLVKTTGALVIYAVALPFLLLGGQGLFMRYAVKFCDHAGRLLCAAGVNVDNLLRLLS